VRWVILAHRYLGIGVGALMAMWCVSGAVMVFVGYPALAPQARLLRLPPLDWKRCCSVDALALGDGESVRGFSIEMLDEHPALKVVLDSGATRVIDLDLGHALGQISPAQARSVATRFIAAGAPTHAVLVSFIDYDQWTVAGNFASDRPLFKVVLGDPDGTHVYVSSRTGRAVQLTTRWQRFWSWLGAIPHWIYFAPLRHSARLWSVILVYGSLGGTLLALSGLYIGARTWLLNVRGLSVHRGLLRWHHQLGLAFGVFVFTWVLSGFLSMNPWGLLEGSGAQPGEMRLHGQPFTGAQVKRSVETLTAGSLPQAVSVESTAIFGRLFLIVSTQGGARFRLDSQARPAPMPFAEVKQIADALTANSGGASVIEWTDREDAYYFSHFDAQARLPVYRILSADRERTRYYIDPISGYLISRIDRTDRAYRWLHGGLHRWDFLSQLRASPQREIVLLSLLTGVIAVSGAGVLLAMRRVFET
jgi:hypothetical protein